MGALLQDLKCGLRMLARNPGFTAVAVLTLALGIGGNVVVFSLLDAVMLRPLPYLHPDRLFMFFPFETSPQRAMVASSYPNFQDWHEQSHAFKAMAGYHEESFNLTGTTEPERLDGLRSTPGLFALLGIPPLLGREFSPNDDQHVALLSYELWHRLLRRRCRDRWQVYQFGGQGVHGAGGLASAIPLSTSPVGTRP